METSSDQNKKKRAGRSPSYPGIDIKTALKRAEELYNKVQHHSSNIDIVASHWGYKKGSGLSAITIAALKKYGFLLDEGSGKDRTVRLTDFALDIIKDNRTDPSEKYHNIIKAALSPKIHKELYEQYGDALTSDADILYHLERQRNFTPNGAKDFLSQYKRTLGYINNLKDDKSYHIIVDKKHLDEDGAKEEADEEESENSPELISFPQDKSKEVGSPSKDKKIKTIQIPMLEGPWPTLTASFPMDEDDWNYMMEVLKTMKPKLVKTKTDEKS